MLNVGDVFAGRFAIEALIGQGGMASVYRVRHQDLGTVHALKVLFIQDGNVADRFILEGQIQARLVHPNVVSVTDVLRQDHTVGLLMEYVDAESLVQLLSLRGALPEEEVLELMGPVLHCVDTAHKAGILHRDLKPANILLRKVGEGLEPLVTDFGIARVRSEEFKAEHTAEGVVLGTPGYMSPEQFLDPELVDVRSDLFSLGAMLYEMLTGQMTFKGKDGRLLLSSTWIEEVAPLHTVCPHCSPSVCDAVMKALEKEPDNRFANIAALVHALYSDHPALKPDGFGEQHPSPGLLVPPATLDTPAPNDPVSVSGQTLVPTTMPSQRRGSGARTALLGLLALLLGSSVLCGVAAILLSAVGVWSTSDSLETDAVSTLLPTPPLETIPPAVSTDSEQPTTTASADTESAKTASPQANNPVAPSKSSPADRAMDSSSSSAVDAPSETPDTPQPTEEKGAEITVAEVAVVEVDVAERSEYENTTASSQPIDSEPTLPSWAKRSETLSGTLYRQSFSLAFKPVPDQRFSATGTILTGTNSRQLQFLGQYNPETAALRFQEVEGDLVIEGQWSSSGLNGTYRRGRRKATALSLTR